MDNGEIDGLYEGLLETLRAHDLGWVVDQVVGEVALGRVLQRDLKTIRVESHGSPLFTVERAESAPTRTGSRDEIPVVEQYRPEDRLRLLIGAIEEAVVESAEMEAHLFNLFGTEANDVMGIEFYSEETNSETMRVDRLSAQTKPIASARLKEHLDALSREI